MHQIILLLHCWMLLVGTAEGLNLLEIPDMLMGDSLFSERNRREIGGVYNDTDPFGRCDFEESIINQMACRYLLYKPYRERTAGTCRSQMDKYYNCIGSVQVYCLKGYLRTTKLEIWKNTIRKFDDTAERRQLLCDFGSVRKSITPSLASICLPSLDQQYKNCFKTFHRNFAQIPGDPILCSQYDEGSACAIKAMKQNCIHPQIDSTLDALSRIITRKSNPFCTQSQGGSDVLAIQSGKLEGSSSSSSIKTLGSNLTMFMTFFNLIIYMMV